jgi:NAD-dependent dihydropyrimidine dehydrogenase PreA subunit
MMQVDLEKCTGCGECVDACSVEAISLIEGKAAIDADTCLSCGACVQACPAGAITEVRLPVAARRVAIQAVEPPAARPVLIVRPENRLAWAKPALSFLGREVVPRLADALMAALDRRLSASQQAEAIYDSGKAPQIRFSQIGSKQFPVRRRQLRWRRRGGKFWRAE